MTLTRRQVRELLDHHGLAPRKALGQHFVADPNTVRRIARLAGVGPGDRVVEVGAGLGALTLALAETGAEVTALETDRVLLPVLAEVLADTGAHTGAHTGADTGAHARVEVVEADALEVDWGRLLGGTGTWHLVANLPYNVATPLIADLLDDVPSIEHMLVMVQREAADRLVAEPGSRAYGIPSVKVAYWATARVVGHVPPSVFVPPPQVESSLVEIVRRPLPAIDVDPDRLFAVVRRAFGQRRKMLRRSLAGVVDAAGFERAGVDPEARPEVLDVEDFGNLARVALLDL